MSTSENIQVIANWLRGYADTGVELGAPAVESIADVLQEAAEDVRKIEESLAMTLARELDEASSAAAGDLEKGATENGIESTREAATDPVARAVLDGIETGKVALFPVIPRPVFGDRGGAA